KLSQPSSSMAQALASSSVLIIFKFLMDQKSSVDRLFSSTTTGG
ncbi:MAG: hypothetical protein ACJAZF_002405, partial [Granulosicoccus sp.]